MENINATLLILDSVCHTEDFILQQSTLTSRLYCSIYLPDRTIQTNSIPILHKYQIMAPCALCNISRAVLKRPKTGQSVCRACFFQVFETEIHNTIQGSNLFQRGERVGIAASGGKDSTVLAHIMTLLNERYDYGLDMCLLSIDEGIAGYRDASLDTVKRNAEQYELPLKILSYDELYGGWTMDKVVQETGKKGNCVLLISRCFNFGLNAAIGTYCGVFRRQALDKGGHILQVEHIVTGHNADDVAETVLMNGSSVNERVGVLLSLSVTVLRGDIARVERCTAITTGGDSTSSDTVKRSKPFKYAYEKEIVM